MEVCVPSALVVGQRVSYEGRVVDESRVQKIRDWPIPQDVSDVRGFLGTCGVVRMFIKGFAALARPLTKLTRKEAVFNIGPDELASITALKDAVIGTPALRHIDYSSKRTVYLSVDSSQTACGYILGQYGEDKKRYPARFGSIGWNKVESQYLQPKIELYGVF